MKIFNILCGLGIAFGIANSKAINNNDNVVEQIKSDVADKQYSITSYEDDKFIYNIHCIDNYNNKCETIKGDLSFALQAISDTFEIYEPLKFDVYVADLIKYKLGFNLAVVNDVNSVALRISDDPSSPPYLFNQALAKQLHLNKKIDYEYNDFNIIVNSNVMIEEMARSFVGELKTTLIHEIIHGLGFYLSGTLSNIQDNKILPVDESVVDLTNAVYLPLCYYNSDKKRITESKNTQELDDYVQNIEIVSFAPLNIFQKYIVDLVYKKPIFDKLGYLHDEFKCFDHIKQSEWANGENIKCYNNLSAETKQNISEIALNYFSQYKSIGFKTNNGTIVPLQTFDNIFAPSASVGHVAVHYLDVAFELMSQGLPLPEELFDESKNYLLYTEENIEKYVDNNFLMYYLATNATNEVLMKTVAQGNKHDLIGPGIVDILTTLGWTEKDEERAQDMYYVADDVIVTELTVDVLNIKKFELDSKAGIANEQPFFPLPTDQPISSVPIDQPVSTAPIDQPTATAVVKQPIATSVDGQVSETGTDDDQPIEIDAGEFPLILESESDSE